jgi:hypothetical protein
MGPILLGVLIGVAGGAIGIFLHEIYVGWRDGDDE